MKLFRCQFSVSIQFTSGIGQLMQHIHFTPDVSGYKLHAFSKPIGMHILRLNVRILIRSNLFPAGIQLIRNTPLFILIGQCLFVLCIHNTVYHFTKHFFHRIRHLSSITSQCNIIHSAIPDCIILYALYCLFLILLSEGKDDVFGSFILIQCKIIYCISMLFVGILNGLCQLPYTFIRNRMHIVKIRYILILIYSYHDLIRIILRNCI